MALGHSMPPPSCRKTPTSLILALLPDCHSRALHAVFRIYFMKTGVARGRAAPGAPAATPRSDVVCWEPATVVPVCSAHFFFFTEVLSAAFINIVFLFSLSLVISLTFPHLPFDNSHGG